MTPVHDSVAELLPAAAVRPVGLPGRLAVVVLDESDAGPLPALFTARTWMVCHVPAAKPPTVTDVVVAPVLGMAFQPPCRLSGTGTEAAGAAASVTLTVCAVFQLSLVKATLDGEKVTPGWAKLSDTGAEGRELSLAVNVWAVLQFSVVNVSPADGAMV